MKRFALIVPLLAVLSVLLEMPLSHAEVWQGAKTLSSTDSSFGLHAVVYGIPNSSSYDTMTFGQFAYGNTDQLQLELRLGFGTRNYYLGGFAKYQLFANEVWAIAIMGGLIQQTYLLLATDFIGSVNLSTFELYTALHFFLPLQGSAMGVGVIPGFDFKLSQWLTFYLEGHLDLADYDTAVSLGFRHFF